MMVFINSSEGSKAVALEDVLDYTIEGGVLYITFQDGSQTVYAPAIWREFDWNPSAD